VKKAIISFTGVVLAMGALAFAIAFTHDDAWLSAWFILFLFVGLPLFLVTLFDLGRNLRSSDKASRAARIAGLALGVPQALFGLLCALCGVALFVAIRYKLTLEGHTGFGYGWTWVFELGPAGLIWYGVVWMRRAFSPDGSAP
jgi:hypothetical protein